MARLRLWLATAVLVAWLAGGHARIPQDLANFCQEHACDTSTLIVRPKTLDDVAEAVRLHDHVQATGEGHSWNQPFFCAMPPAPTLPAPSRTPASAPSAPPTAGRKLFQIPPDNSSAAGTNTSAKPTAANIVMRTIRPLNISVNETEESVWVDAGVITADLLAYLASYVTPDAPAGYTLPAFPWFVYQSIGGAVATGTHGSSLKYASLSHQVLALDVILANGTRKVFTNETDSFLMKALRVSVGQLGIIGRLKMQIVKEVPVRRSLKLLSLPQFLELMTSAQESIVKGDGIPAWMNETQQFWLPQQQQVMFIAFTRADQPDPEAAKNALAGFLPDSSTVFSKKGDLVMLGEWEMPADAQLTRFGQNNSQVLVVTPADGVDGRDAEPYRAAQRWLDGFLNNTINKPVNISSASVDVESEEARVQGVSWTVPEQNPPSAVMVGNGSAVAQLGASAAGINFVAANMSAESATIYVKHPAISLPGLRTIPFDQYEVSIPVTTMADCWRKIFDTVYEGDLEGKNATQKARDKGLRTASLIRFIGAEDGLLSHTHDGPRVYVNTEDYVYYNSVPRTANQPFRKLMALFTNDPACTAKGPTRLHWGKAGWPDKGCWHGDEHYGDNWCHFGCAVKQLDPTRKFKDSAPDRWTWEGVDLDKCCGPEGFRVGTSGCECKVQHERAMSDCPPAPFYTKV